MNLDDVQSVKAEIFRNEFQFRELPVAAAAGHNVPLFAPVPGSEPFRAIESGRRKKDRDPRDLMALGVLPPNGHNRDPNSMRLGIFIQKHKLHQHPIVQAAVTAAHGQARVIYTGPIRRLARPQPVNSGPHRPLSIGSSIGHYRISAGTLGCICRHRDSGGIGLLSNNHILADTNGAQRGDIILQPARADGGRRTNVSDKVATLYEYVPIQFDVGARNFVDCAFATMLGGVLYDGSVAQDPADPRRRWQIRSAPADVIADDAVQKIGRTTGWTSGRVIAIDVENVIVAMILGQGEKLARFDRQIAIEGDAATPSFSKPGDSGSLVWTADGSPAALLFAGTEQGGVNGRGVTFANPIQPVLDALDLDIHTET
ncbi:hypothetical protein [Methylobacterium sp. JK268]